MPVSFLREFLASSDWKQMRGMLEDAVDSPILWVVSSNGRAMEKADENYHDLCKLIRSSTEGLRRCRNSHHTRLQEVKRTGQPAVSACYCGLVCFALPLILDNDIIGVAGGCHNRSESPITMEKCAEISAACNIDLGEVMAHAKKIKNIPKIEQKRFLITLSTFAGMASLVMKWTNRLFLTLSLEDQYSAKLSSLSEIGNLAASELDWLEMLKTITGKTKALLGADACTVYVLDQKQNELVLSATDGLPVAAVGQRIKVGEGITGHVAQTRVAAAVEDVTRDPRTRIFSLARRPGKKQISCLSILSVPLVAQDRLIGVIDVRNLRPKAWTQTDMHFLSITAGHIAGIIEKDKFRMEIGRELEAARYIQAKLLPDPLPEIGGYDLATLIVPSSQVGGDYYDLIVLDKQRLGIVIADVSGKGIGAAILMASTQGMVNAYARRDMGTAEVLFNVNNALYKSTELEKFVTMFYGILDTKTNVLKYTNAGHNHPFIYKTGSKEPQPLDTGGMVLGMIEDTRYDEGSIDLADGDILVLYSDGVTEARNKEGQMFDIHRLHDVVYRYIEENSDKLSAQELLKKIYSAVCDFSISELLADDLTIMVLRRL